MEKNDDGWLRRTCWFIDHNFDSLNLGAALVPYIYHGHSPGSSKHTTLLTS